MSPSVSVEFLLDPKGLCALIVDHVVPDPLPVICALQLTDLLLPAVAADDHLDAMDPPLLLIQGGKDTLCAPAQAREMAVSAMKAGTEVHLGFYPEIGHVPTDPDVFRTISRFMDRHLGTTCSSFFDSIWPIEQPVTPVIDKEVKD